MNPAEKLAALRMLQHGIGEAVKAAEDEAKAFQQSVRAKSLETDWGTVSVVRKGGAVRLDPDDFLEHVRYYRPDEVVVTEDVRPSYAKAFKDQLEVVDGEVIDPSTGQVLTWATVGPDTEYLSVRLSSDAKADAATYVAGQLDSLLPKGIHG